MNNDTITHSIKQNLRKLMAIIKELETCKDIQPDHYQKQIKSFNNSLTEIDSDWKLLQKNNSPIKLFTSIE